MFHAVPILALHRVHHSDVDLDATSACASVIRFFPVIKLAAIVTLGPPVLAVLAFELSQRNRAL